MKKTFLLLSMTGLCAVNTFAQVGIENTGTSAPTPPAQTTTPATPIPPTTTAPAPVTPVYIPPPPPPPATTVTTTTTAASTTYVPRKGSIDVNRIRFGAYLAPDISWMKPTTATDDENKFKTQSNGSKIGFTYGLMADYFFAENYGLVTGISINSTGGKIEASRINSGPDTNQVHKAVFDYRLQYLDIPLALKLRTDNINGFRFFGQLGVSLGFNISKKADYTVTYSNAAGAERDTSGTKIKLTGSVDNIAPIMFQMNIGAGAEYPINNKLSLYVALFFNNGFAPDATHPEKFDNDKLGYKGEFRDANTRLNNFALRVGLFF